MSDPATQGSPPAGNGGITKADLQAILAPLVTQVTELSKAHASLMESHKALQESAKNAPPAIKAEDVAGLVTKQLAEHQKTQADATAKQQAKAALREKVVAARLPGVPKELLAALPDTEDEAALTAAADGLRKTIEGLPGVKLADVGGAAKDGGATPNAAQPPAKTPANSNLTDGQAKFAAGMKLPSP